MDVLIIENKMIEIKSEPLEMVVEPRHHHHKSTLERRRSSSSPGSEQQSPPAAEMEPRVVCPILYTLLTAPKSFKPKNSEELQLLPPSLELFCGSDNSKSGQDDDDNNIVGVKVTSRVQLLQCGRSRRTRRRESSSEECADELDDNEDFMEEDIDSLTGSSSSSSSRSSSSSPHMVDSSSNLSVADDRDYLIGASSNNSHIGDEGDMSEDESTCSLIGSPEDHHSCSGGDDSVDDNIPTSTTSGFKRKACRLETAIGNIVKRKVRGQKRSCNNYGNNVPISMAPSSPTVSTTCVDPPTPSSRGKSEILERILRSTNNTTPNQQRHHSPTLRNHNNDDNNNNNEGSYDGPYAKLRDLLTMPEDQMVKRRRIEYGLNENNYAKVYHQAEQSHEDSESANNHSQRRREFSPPRNNILASLLQKGRAPYEPTSSSSPFNQHYHPHQVRSLPSLVQINGSSSSSKLLGGNSRRLNVIVNMNDERPYKCSLCDLRFKKLPLLNRHVKTHSHIKRHVCRFCSHAFKRSDNLLAHMRTSCRGGARSVPPSPPQNRNAVSNQNRSQNGQIINQLLSTPPTAGGPTVSRSQLEEALLNLRAHHHEEEPLGQQHQDRRYNSPSSPLVSTTTASPPPQLADFQSKHSKLLEILSGSPVNLFPVPVGPVIDHDEDTNEVEEEQDMPLPLSLKVDRSESSSPSACSPSSSSSPSQYHRSHYHHHHNQLRNALYPNELPLAEEGTDEEVGEVFLDDEVENDNEQPLNLGRQAAVVVAHPAPSPPSAKSRDHPEIVSILSRQPKSNVVMLAAADLRKLVDTL